MSSIKTSLNLGQRSIAARDRIVERTGGNTTDAVNSALVIADTMWDLSDNGRLTVIRPDGTQVLVVLP